MVICGGPPAAEKPDLTRVIRLSQVEQAMLDGWSIRRRSTPGPAGGPRRFGACWSVSR